MKKMLVLVVLILIVLGAFGGSVFAQQPEPFDSLAPYFGTVEELEDGWIRIERIQGVERETFTNGEGEFYFIPYGTKYQRDGVRTNTEGSFEFDPALLIWTGSNDNKAVYDAYVTSQIVLPQFTAIVMQSAEGGIFTYSFEEDGYTFVGGDSVPVEGILYENMQNEFGQGFTISLNETPSNGAISITFRGDHRFLRLHSVVPSLKHSSSLGASKKLLSAAHWAEDLNDNRLEEVAKEVCYDHLNPNTPYIDCYGTNQILSQLNMPPFTTNHREGYPISLLNLDS